MFWQDEEGLAEEIYLDAILTIADAKFVDKVGRSLPRVADSSSEAKDCGSDSNWHRQLKVKRTLYRSKLARVLSGSF